MAQPKILLVDDDSLMHRLYRQHIERAGYQMLSAYNGVEAVAVATRETPQLIIMDIMMPELDGLSAIREIKREVTNKAVPVIVVTANPQYHLSQKESEWAGASLFLTKPFGPASLVAAIQRLVPTAGPQTESTAST
jgi:two-component system, OmpR family, alkaline phosphatase synthesis response regulator PhoP